jgi:hypothetical protein
VEPCPSGYWIQSAEGIYKLDRSKEGKMDNLEELWNHARNGMLIQKNRLDAVDKLGKVARYSRNKERREEARKHLKQIRGNPYFNLEIQHRAEFWIKGDC